MRELRVEERVSRGMEETAEGSTTKQSSNLGVVAPSVKVSFGLIPSYGTMFVDIGIPPASSGR